MGVGETCFTSQAVATDVVIKGNGNSVTGIIGNTGYALDATAPVWARGGSASTTLEDIVFAQFAHGALARGLTNLSGNGGNGGALNLLNTSLKEIDVRGGDGSSDGGDGGIVDLVTSTSTIINADGGDSTSCGNGGAGGSLSLTTDSSYSAYSNEPGSGQNVGCPSSSKSGGRSGLARTNLTSPGTARAAAAAAAARASAAPARTSAGSSEALREFRKATALSLSTVSLPVNLVGRLPALTPLPVFGGTGKGSFSFESPVARFLFEPLPAALAKSLAPYPRLSSWLSSVGISNAQSLASAKLNPRTVSSEASLIPGIYAVSLDGGALARTSLSSDASSTVFQQASVAPGARVSVSVSGGAGAMGSFDGRTLSFGKDGLANLTVPTAPGSYVLTSSASPLALILRVHATVETAVSPSPAGPSARPTLWQRIRGLFGMGTRN
jgi:hypothetical protein